MSGEPVPGAGPASRPAMITLGLALAALVATWLAAGLFGMVAVPVGCVLALMVWLRPPPTAATIVGVLGAITAACNAAAALVQVGSVPPYDTRQALGWLALGLPLLAVVAAAQVRARPRLTGAAMLLIGLTGFIAINLFYIDTWYVAGSVLLVVAGLWAMLAPGRPVA